MKNVFLLVICLFVQHIIFAQDFKAYNNYDFIAGDQIIFEDDFTEAKDGEFPPRWNLVAGQGVVNIVHGKPAFVFTEGSYAKIAPAMKKEKYLPTTFTVEFDFYLNDASSEILVFLKEGEEEGKHITFGLNMSSPACNTLLNAAFPGGFDGFEHAWHHAAMVYKDDQIKCYIDQYRVLVVPKCGIKPESILIGGVGSLEIPLVCANVKIASGGGMNMLDKILKDGKWVTTGITFDVNKSTLKPESMGVLNEVVKLMKSKPELKFEIGGHTDSDGNDAANLSLSQARADAVKKQLITLGIDGSRLTTKGYGEAKPISNNTSAEGKASNRRVEFVKM